MNRGSSTLHVLGFVLGVASMRPRFMNRGSSDSCLWIQHLSPSFNEAPIHESGKSLLNRRPSTFEIMLQ